MTPEEIYAIAGRAVGATMWDRRRWWDEDRQDARQAAAIGVLLALRRRPKQELGYYCVAAKHAVIDWMRECIFPGDSLPENLAAQAQEDQAEISAVMCECLDKIGPMLCATRTRSRKTAEQATALEVQFIRLMLEGYSVEGAANEMGRTLKNTYALREQRVLPKLRMILDQKCA